MRHHPANPDFHRTLFNSVNLHGVTSILTAPIEAVGGLLGGKTQTPAALPAPAAAPVVPTVDTAASAVQQQQQQDTANAQKKGALATLLSTGSNSTGASLGAGAPETTLKRFLG